MSEENKIALEGMSDAVLKRVVLRLLDCDTIIHRNYAEQLEIFRSRKFKGEHIPKKVLLPHVDGQQCAIQNFAAGHAQKNHRDLLKWLRLPRPNSWPDRSYLFKEEERPLAFLDMDSLGTLRHVGVKDTFAYLYGVIERNCPDTESLLALLRIAHKIAENSVSRQEEFKRALPAGIAKQREDDRIAADALLVELNHQLPA